MDRKQRRVLRRAAQAESHRLTQEVRASSRAFWRDAKARGISREQARRELFRNVYGGDLITFTPPAEASTFNWQMGEAPGREMAEPLVFSAHVSETVTVAENASQRRITRAARDAANSAYREAQNRGVHLLMPTAHVSMRPTGHGLLEVHAFALVAGTAT